MQSLNVSLNLDVDRHNNYLVLKTNKLYADALPCAVPPLSIFSEIQVCEFSYKQVLKLGGRYRCVLHIL